MKRIDLPDSETLRSKLSALNLFHLANFTQFIDHFSDNYGDFKGLFPESLVISIIVSMLSTSPINIPKQNLDSIPAIVAVFTEDPEFGGQAKLALDNFIQEVEIEKAAMAARSKAKKP